MANEEKLNDKIKDTPVRPNKKLNLFEKMLAISSRLEIVPKNLEVSISATGKYKAVGELDVLRAVKPLEIEYGVFSYPVEREIVESGTIESVDSRGNAKKQLFERVKVVYRFVNVENTNEYIDITSYGDGIDTGDKSVGKAMTYADKYALMKAYKMMTGDDPDQEASGELKGAKIKKDLDPKLLARCAELGIELNKVAIWLKVNVDDLTNENLKMCIARKEKTLTKENPNG